METKRIYRYAPTFSCAYGTGWKVMTDNFLRLLLVVILMAIISGPMSFFGHSNCKIDNFDFDSIPYNMDDFFKIGAVGLAAAFLGLIALMYALLLRPVFRYGAKMMFVQAARGITPDFDMLISGFRKNYLNIVLANLLVTALVGIGIICLIIPGIIIGCRLAFTAYLVMDKGLDPIKAAEESWRLTRGHGWRIFLMGFVAFFIYIAGFICFFIGVFIADMWVRSAYATLYHSVLLDKGLYTEPVPVTDSTPSGSAPSGSAPSGSAAADSAPAGSAPTGSAAADSAPAGSTSSGSTTVDSASSGSAAADSAPSGSATSDAPREEM